LPDALQPWLLASPFAALADIPYRIYCGGLTLQSASVPLAVGFVWSILLVLLGRLLVTRAQSRIVVQGG
jgi:ABC-2 type transport system permease protein